MSLVTEEETSTLPRPTPTYEPSMKVPGGVEATSLEHQTLRAYRSRFNKEWFDLRKLLDELQEMTMLSYDTAGGFWAPYLTQVDEIDHKVTAMSETVAGMKRALDQVRVLMATHNVPAR